MIIIIFINIIVISLAVVVSSRIDIKDTKALNDFYKLECKKYRKSKHIND